MEDRIILVDKPAGISSFGIVAKVRRELRDEFGHKVKVGHTGTLDPFATGLLILLSGKMTKKSNEFLKLDKIVPMQTSYTQTADDRQEEGKNDSGNKDNKTEVEPSDNKNPNSEKPKTEDELNEKTSD